MYWYQAFEYVRRGSVSPAQSFLKHSLVPLSLISERLAKDAIVLDLGCGEGILTNSLAERRPDCRFIGIDLDASRLALAQRHARPNSVFHVGDIFALDLPDKADAAILNDVVHHHEFAKQGVLLHKVLSNLKPGGLLILKEVDRNDRLDLKATTFFDSRLYPDDTLCFRTLDDWKSLLHRLGVTSIDDAWFPHPWPASRTLLFVTRPKKLNAQEQSAARIGAGNMRARKRGQTVVFMTGATGFLGGHLAGELLRNGLEGKPVRLVYLSRDPKREAPDLGDAVPLYGDLDEMPRLGAALMGVDYVFHLAAEVKLTGGADIWRNNYHGTLALLEACKAQPELKRFVHASTIGAVDRRPDDPCLAPLTEDHAPHPLSDYGRTKLEAEKAVCESGLPYSILRIPWGYGPGMTPDTHVWFLTDAVARKKLFSRVRFPGYVTILSASDLIDALVLLAHHKKTKNEIFFAGDGRPLSLGDLFSRYASVIGQRAWRVAVPGPITYLARKTRSWLPFQVQCLASHVLWASPEKLFNIGFRPRLTQRQGLALLAEAQGRREPLVEPDGRHRLLISLVTGAAGGIGRAVAETMAGNGHKLLLVDRDVKAMKSVAEKLDAEQLALDLTDPAAVGEIEAFLDDKGYVLDWVVNNAGAGVRGRVGDLDPAVHRSVESLNCAALVDLSALAIRHFRRVKVGTLINIGSSAGFQPLPYMAVYAASKAFVRSFTLALAGETADCPGINVVLVIPSGTDTSFQAAAGVNKSPGEKLLTPDDVARGVVSVAYRGATEITIGRSGRAMALAARVLPRTLQTRLWTSLMAKMR